MFLFNETFSMNEDKTSKFEKLDFQYILVDYPSSGEILKHTTYGRIATPMTQAHAQKCFSAAYCICFKLMI